MARDDKVKGGSDPGKWTGPEFPRTGELPESWWVFNGSSIRALPLGDPRIVAAKKAALFPDEGGPAILEVEVPVDIVGLAVDVVVEIRFEPRWGLEELRKAWPVLSKRILEP